MRKNERESSRSFKGMAVAMIVVIVMSLFGTIEPPSAYAGAITGTTYYVDSQGGNDSNDGLSDSTAWQSLTKVSSVTFQPGDRILLKTGSEWTGEQLYPKGSGAEGNPITIDKYGDGSEKPRLNGASAVDSVVNFYNQQYWDIRNLEITNTAAGAPDDPARLGDYRGIHVSGQDAGELKHFYLSDLFIHDVTGWDKWIGGSTADDVPGSGIYHGAGWDGSKRTGAILFETLQPGATPVPTFFDDVDIENSAFQDNSFGGIIFKQYEGDVHWASRDDGKSHSSPDDPLGQWYDPEWTPHTNIVIRNNYFSQYNSDFACDTIYLTSVKNALVEHNVSAGAGTSAIEMYYTDNITVQYNEVYDTLAKAGGADSNAIDPDKESTNILIQYNYIHNTGDGILLCGFVFGTATVRYNVIQDAAPGKRFLNPHGDKGTQLVYNNIFYNTSGSSVALVNSSGGSSYLNDSDYTVKFFNNLFYNAANSSSQTVTIASGTGTIYDRNLYYGSNMMAPAGDIHAILGDPKFAGPVPTTRGDLVTGPILDFTGFRLMSGSAAIGNGLDEAGMDLANSTMTYTDNGGLDFAGHALYNGKPDIGAFEYYGDPAATAEAITGQVKDTAGNPIAGADVSAAAGGSEYSGITNAAGFYSITGVPVGKGYTVTASKEYYQDGTADGVDVVAGDTTSGIDLTVVSTNPSGTIEGTVRDTSDTANPPAIAGAAVSIGVGDATYATTTTDEAGHFSVAGLTAESGYWVTVSKTGYQSWTATSVAGTPIEIDPGTTTAIGDLYLPPGKPSSILSDNFDSYAAGALPDGWTATATVSGDSVGVAEFPSAEDKSVIVSQPSKGSSGKKTSLYKTLDSLRGIVTVEYSINKSNTSQYFSLPMLYGDSSSHIAVCVAMDNTGIIYKDGGSSGTSHVIRPYTANTWYDFRIVLNTITKRFDLYIDGVKSVDQGSFRYADATTDALTGMEFYANYNVTGSVYVDDVRITQGIAYAADNADLSGLEADAGPLAQTDASHYALNVPNFVDHVALTPTTDSDLASGITVDGHSVASGQTSPAIPLAEGENEIPVVVTAEDGTTKRIYTVTVNRTPADIDATLQTLTASDGTLQPAFRWDTTEYSVSVPYSASGIAFSPMAGVEGATVTINGIATPNGQPSANVSLQVGDNTVTITVGSKDGTNFLDYTVTVTREPNPNPEPDTTPPALTLTEPGRLTGNHYNVPKGTLHVAGTISEPGVVYVNGVQANVGDDLTFSADIDLRPGMNRIDVTAIDSAGNAAEPVGYNVVPSK